MEKTFFSFTYNRLLTSLVLVMLVAALGTYAYYTLQQSKYIYTGPTTISISGTGEVVGVPDIGTFSFSVTEAGVDAATAQAGSATKINEILTALKEQGIEERDIKTEYYSLYPKYKYESAACFPGSYCPGKQVQDGFEVSQTIVVKVRDLTKAGSLLALAGEKGATNITGLSFTIDEPEILKAEARTLAIEDAKEKAQALAGDLNVRLVKMVGYYEDEYMTPYYDARMGGDMMMAESAQAAPSVPTGENTTTSRVTLTYQVK